ncbi:MAG: TylF/MycF/NovP-related O-methyltransferase [Labilithrix sp.]
MMKLRDLRRFRDPRRLWQRVVLYSKVVNPYVSWQKPASFDTLFATARTRTLLSETRAHMLFSLARHAVQLEGSFAEIGVYRGGTAYLLANVAKTKKRDLHLFDTFEGMPETDVKNDLHTAGDFADTSLESVRKFVGNSAEYHQGFFPATAAGLEDTRFSFAHVDVDIHQSVADCCSFFYPRMTPGGVMVFDDYGWTSCPGAKRAVDDYFADKPEPVLHLSTAQAIVIKLP